VTLEIDGSMISKIVQQNPWTLIIELRDGKRIVVEPGLGEEAEECGGDVECILDALSLEIIHENGDGGE
jgi:hypothetical protein